MKNIIFTLFLFLSLTACQQPLVKSIETETETDLETLFVEAEKEYQLHNYQTALPLYKKINQKLPHNANMWLRTGNIYARLNQPTQAIECYQQAVKSNPQLAIAWHNLGILQLRQAARTLTQMAKNIHSDDPLYPRAVRLSEATLNILGIRRQQEGE